MENQHHQAPPRPIMSRAAENGLFIGLYICGLMFCTALAFHYSFASLLVWVGSIAMPFYLFRLISRSDAVAKGNPGFAELWAEGIATFFLGTLIPALVCYVCLRFIWPTFIVDSVSSVIEMLRTQNSPQNAAMADTITAMVQKAGYPGPTDVTAQLISFNIIAGTALSLLVAIVVKTGSISRRMPPAKNK